MRYPILSALVIFSMVVACAPKEEKKKPIPQPASPSNPPRGGSSGAGGGSSAKCATRDDSSIAPERKVQRQTINVKMEKQRVIRKDCDGKVISDKMEKVTMPIGEVLLKPEGGKIGTGFAVPYNRTTCSGQGFELGRIITLSVGIGLAEAADDDARNKKGYPSLRFTVDTSPTVGAMHVRKNTNNYIDYEFKKCLEKSGDNCVKSETTELGTLILTVNYTENLDIGGVKEIPASDCEPKN